MTTGIISLALIRLIHSTEFLLVTALAPVRFFRFVSEKKHDGWRLREPGIIRGEGEEERIGRGEGDESVAAWGEERAEGGRGEEDCRGENGDEDDKEEEEGGKGA